MQATTTDPKADGAAENRFDLPDAAAPYFRSIPDVRTLWTRLFMVGWFMMAYFLLDALSIVFMEYWYLESLGLSSVFWTNFGMGAALFVVGLVVYAVAIAGPAFLHNVPPWARRLNVHIGLYAGLIAGYYLAMDYLNFLVLFNGASFGKADPVYGNDIGFYVFTLPAVWTVGWALLWVALFAFLASLWCASIAERDQSAGSGAHWFTAYLRRVSTPYTLGALGAFGVLLGIGQWLTRYDLLYKENMDQMIYAGAQYVDVTGLFSTLNDYQLTALVIVGITAAIIFALVVLRRNAGPVSSGDRVLLKRAAQFIVLLVIVDFAFKLGVWVRDTVFVDPNEPVIQLKYIKHHIDSTLDAYALNDIEDIRFVPKDDGDPLPDADQLLQSAALKNVPLWPGYVAYLESHIDPQHAERILQTGGDTMVYGPTKELFRQKQKLVMYYDFINVDAVRYKNSAKDGEKEMFASAVRELPVRSPQPYLYQWGQRNLYYTHGYGLVSSWASAVSAEGEPIFAAKSIPAESVVPEFETEDPYIYFGEGSETMFFSNLNDMRELGHPTEDPNAPELVEFPRDVEAGVRMDSFLKRLVIGWRSDEVNYPHRFWEVLVSGLITDETRCHYWRTPIERLEHVAPFLYYDSNIWAVVVDGRVEWMVNGLTSTDMYPYSQFRVLGDKATVRTKYPRPHVMHNYVRDAVKCTVNASTGEIKFYKFADEPIINTWAKIYPNLFVAKDEMPRGVRDHLQYPLQMFHRQFDDIYKTYHMKDPLVFFNMEDEWDDCDEVLGPVLDSGEAITFSFEPYHWITGTGDGILPPSKEGTQFAMSMPFTPEKSLNLRAVGLVYQDGDDYGKLYCLQVPRGNFRMSPEQADAAIDQEPDISEQISWWNRLGTDVIHGHTTPIVVDGEVIYVAPIFIRSQQEPVTQLKKICVVFRGHARMGDTLEEALKLAIEASKPSAAEGEPPVAIGGAGG